MSVIGADAVGHRITVPSRPGAHLVLDWASRTDVGLRRAVNEDSVVAHPPIFAVADGMGGHAAGDRASAAVVERLAGAAREPGPIDLVHLQAALSAAARDIDELAEGIPIGVGTTVTGAALVWRGERPEFAVFNIGDSRVYAYADGDLRQVTVDHSVVQELVDAGMLDAADAEGHPESNVITRAVGFRERPRPDLWTVPALAGLRLLVCSDGLTKEVPVSRLRDLLGSGSGAADTADALVDAALVAGGRDNITVVVVDVVAVPGAPSHGRRRARPNSGAAPGSGRNAGLN